MKLNKSQIEDLQNFIRLSLDKVYSEDMYLIEVGGSEQSIVAQLSIYINEHLRKNSWTKDYKIDSEYRKNGKELKKTPSNENGIRPDIIVHNRGNNNENILVMEFKLNAKLNSSNRNADIQKLNDLTNQNGEYKYALGVFVNLKNEDYELEYILDYSPNS